MKDAVIFKIIHGEIIALFPQVPWNTYGEILSYMHIGQHGAASKDLLRELPTANELEYLPLKKELELIGYELKIINN